MEIVALEAAMETNVIHKNPLPPFQIQFIIMKKFVVCNFDWLVWMMNMPHDAGIVYTSNRQDRENISMDMTTLTDQSRVPDYDDNG